MRGNFAGTILALSVMKRLARFAFVAAALALRRRRRRPGPISTRSRAASSASTGRAPWLRRDAHAARSLPPHKSRKPLPPPAAIVEAPAAAAAGASEAAFGSGACRRHRIAIEQARGGRSRALAPRRFGRRPARHRAAGVVRAPRHRHHARSSRGLFSLRRGGAAGGVPHARENQTLVYERALTSDRAPARARHCKAGRPAVPAQQWRQRHRRGPDVR